MEFWVLGPLEAFSERGKVELGGPKPGELDAERIERPSRTDGVRSRSAEPSNVGGQAGARLIPPEVERKCREELEAYLLGRRVAAADQAA